MLNITYKDRKTNIWVRERTKVLDIINTVRKMKWSWAGHVNRLKDDRWTSRVTNWRPCDKKIRQGRPAKLDKYWSTLKDRRDCLCKKYFINMQARSHKVNCLLPEKRHVDHDLRRGNTYPLPVTRTHRYNNSLIPCGLYHWQ